MPVAQGSSRENSVGAGSPRRVSVISRLRRVAASSRTILAGAFRAYRCDVGERLPLRAARVVEQGAAGGKGERAGPRSRSRRARRRRTAAHSVCVRARRRSARRAGESASLHRDRRAPGRRRRPGFRPARCVAARCRAPAARPQRRAVARWPGSARRARRRRGRRSARAAGCPLLVEQRRVGERARRDDARHLALDRALGRWPGRRSARRWPPIRRAAPACARYCSTAWKGTPAILIGAPAEAPRVVSVMSSRAAALLGVVVEQLVEIAHAVEQQHVRMLRLDAQVLLHHRRVGFERGVHAWQRRILSARRRRESRDGVQRSDLRAAPGRPSAWPRRCRPSPCSLRRPAGRRPGRRLR